MANSFPLLNWPRNFPLLHIPIRTPGPFADGYIPFGDVAHDFGITFNALGIFRHRRFGPRHIWRNGWFVVSEKHLDEWMNRGWRPREQETLAELQHTNPADFLKNSVKSSFEEIGAIQRKMK